MFICKTRHHLCTLCQNWNFFSTSSFSITEINILGNFFFIPQKLLWIFSSITFFVFQKSWFYANFSNNFCHRVQVVWINKCCCLYARDQILHVNYPTEFRLLTHSNSNFSVYLYVPIIIHHISFAYFSLELRKQMSELFGQKNSCTCMIFWYRLQHLKKYIEITISNELDIAIISKHLCSKVSL